MAYLWSRQIVAPAVEPVTLEEFKTHLRFTGDATEDALLEALITAARQEVEAYTWRQLISQTWHDYHTDMPLSSRCPFRLKNSPFAVEQAVGIKVVLRDHTHYSIFAVSYVGYIDNADRGLVYLANTETDRWLEESQLSHSRPDVAQIEYTVGYGATGAEVPSSLRQPCL